MAKADINLDIKTHYHGEGMGKLDNAIKRSSGNINRVGEIMEKVSSSMDGMSGAAGKAGASIAKLAGGMASGGVLGIAIAAAQVGITKLIEKWQEWENRGVEAAKKVAEALKTAVADAVKTSKNHLDALVNAMKGVSTDRNAGFRMGTIKGKGMLDRMELQRQEALRGKSGEEAAKINLEWEKKIQKEKSKDSVAAEKNAAQDLADQRNLVKDLQARMNQRVEQRNDTLKQSAEYAKQLDPTDPDSNQNRILQSQINELDKVSAALEAEIKEYEKRIREESSRIKPLEEKAEQARQDRLTQELASQAKIKDAEQKLNDEVKKRYEKEGEQAKKRRQEAIDAANKLADTEKKNADEVKKEVKERTKKELEKQKKELAEQEKDKQAAANKNVDAAKARLDNYTTLASDAAGKDFNQWTRGNRDEAREQANAARQEQNRIKQNDQQLKSLEGRIFSRNGKLLKSANQKDIQQYKDRLRWKELHDPEVKKKLEQDVKDAEAQKEKVAKDTKDAVERIEGLIEKLAL